MTRSAIAAVAFLMTFGPGAGAQVSYSVTGGFTWAGPGGWGGPPGVALDVSMGARQVTRTAWRLEAYVSWFDLSQPSGFAGVLCMQDPPPGTCCGVCATGSTTAPVWLAGVAANEIFGLTKRTDPLGLYVIGGAELGYLDRPSNSVSPWLYQGGKAGVSGGLGITWHERGHAHPFVLEARYHRLLGADSPSWYLPVTFGVQF